MRVRATGRDGVDLDAVVRSSSLAAIWVKVAMPDLAAP